MTSLWLNTIIPIIVMVLVIKDDYIDISLEGLFKGIQCLLLFNVRILSNAYRETTQTHLLGVMCLSRQVDR